VVARRPRGAFVEDGFKVPLNRTRVVWLDANTWTVSLWSRNLTNKYYYEAVAITGAFQQFPGVPRTYGLTATVNFE
jgi:outer membrane receptor protein involved in Fe transport